MFEQALELRIELFIVLDAIDKVRLHHPFDVQRRDCDAQRVVCQYRARDLFRWSNDRAISAKTFFKFLPETFEQLNMLGLFTGKLQERTHTIVVATELRPGVVQHERQDEFFDQSEDAQVSIPSDLIQNKLFFFAEKRQLLDSRESFGHE